MDAAQSLLFGEFPRAMGVTTPNAANMELRQFLVHSKTEFDGVVEDTAGEHNLYSSISAYEPVKVDGKFEGCAVRGDKVSFDFDTPAKADPEEYPDLDPEDKPRWDHPEIPDHATDKQVLSMMRRKESMREEVLSDVCWNVRELTKAANANDIPCLGVFSGFGVHVHIFHEETMSRVGDKMLSTANWLTSTLNLALADERATGRPFRIMRIPNVERVDHEAEDESTGVYTVPLRADEMVEITPTRLMDLSQSPRLNIGSSPGWQGLSRPELKVRSEYLGPGDSGVGQEKMRPIPEQSVDDELAAELVKRICRMPCVYERALTRNPPNDVRVKMGIMFLNAGYSPEETTDIISKLGWVDFDRNTTEYQLKKLEESGKGDWSCKTMQAKGLCTRADNKEECPTYGYRGGNNGQHD